MYIHREKSRAIHTKEPHGIKEPHITAIYVKNPYSKSRIIYTKEPRIIAKRALQ